MAGNLANPDFFKKKGKLNTAKEVAEKSVCFAQSVVAECSGEEKLNVNIKINPRLLQIADEATELLKNAKLDSFAKELDSITRETERQRFTVAVVGEFSRGKSTFINKLFNREILPVANMPTTALLTRIRYSEKEAIKIIDTVKKQKKVLPLSADSWDNYVADDRGNDPSGVAFVGIDSPWLKNGIEVIDTPGAGDLESKRAAIIGEALNGSDSAIITISAEAAMSMTEKLFIEERLIAKNTPFLMLIITKLDRIDVAQRNSIVDFVKAKLQLWGMENIPVYVPYDMEMPDDKYTAIMGMDKVKSQINSWLTGSERRNLTEKWLSLRIKAHLQSVADFVKEQKCIAEAENEEKRNQLIAQKSEKLNQSAQVWENIKVDMVKKSSECYKLFLRKAEEYKTTVAEKLQHEMSRASNLKKWWDEDYPYRLKIEMTNMSVNMEKIVSQQVAKDVVWLNSLLEKNFRTGVLYTIDELIDKKDFTNVELEKNIEVADWSRERNLATLGVTALSMASALMFMSVGAAFIGTVGVGKGGALISDVVFKKKIESQKEMIKEELANSIPVIIGSAMERSESRIKNIYKEIISEAEKQQRSWLESQRKIIESSEVNITVKDTRNLTTLLKNICLMQKKLQDYNA